MKRLKVLLIGFVVVALILTSACGNSGSKASSANSGSKTTITYWSMWNKGEPQQKVIQNIIDDYEKSNPNVKIKVQWMGREVLPKVRNAVQAGNGPDLTDQDAAEIFGSLGKNDLMANLSPVLDKKIPNENVPVKSVFTKGLLNLHKKDGNIVFIPYEFISSGFFYNEKLFNKLGVKPPRTWDEFIATAKKIKSKGVAPIALDGSDVLYDAYYYYWLSDRINGPGALKKAAGDKTGKLWDNPGFLEAAKKVQELAKLGLFQKGYSGSQYPAAQTAWAKGKSAMLLCGTWIPSETNSYTPDDFKYRAFAFPEVKGGKGNYHNMEAYLIGWAALKGSNVKAVENFIAFAMQKKYQKGIVDMAKNISTRKDLNVPGVLSDFQQMLKNKTGLHTPYDGLQAKYPKWLKTVFFPLDTKLIYGKVSAKDFISQLKQQSKQYWANN